MARMQADALKRRIDAAWAKEANWRSLLDDAYSLACPGRNHFQKERTPGDSVGNEVFDSTLEHSLHRFANQLLASLFPPFQDFAEYVIGPLVELAADDNQKAELRAKAEAATTVVFTSINTSNFHMSTHEVFLDLGFGTGAMYVNDMPLGDDQIFECVAVNPAELSLEVGANGKVWGIYRKHKMPYYLVAATWPDFNPPRDWDKLAQESKEGGTDMVSLEEAHYFDYETNKWYMDVLLCGDTGGNSDNTPVRVVERTYDMSRWVIPRWSRNTGETRGRGPVLQALPTAKSLNKAKELLFINASLQIHPILTYIDDGIFNPGVFSLIPGSMTAVGYNAGSRGPSIQALDLGGDLRLTQFIFEEMQMDIKKIMLDDQLPSEKGSVRSATEFNSRERELFQSKGAPYARIHYEFTQPIMRILLDIHIKKGILEDIKYDGRIIDLKITAPFAQTQNANEVSSMAQLLEFKDMLGEETFNVSIKTELIPGFFVDKLGLSIQKYVRTPDERKALIEEGAAVMQQQQQQEQDNALEQQGAGQPQGAQ